MRKAGPDNEVQRRFSMLKPCVMTRGCQATNPPPVGLAVRTVQKEAAAGKRSVACSRDRPSRRCSQGRCDAPDQKSSAIVLSGRRPSDPRLPGRGRRRAGWVRGVAGIGTLRLGHRGAPTYHRALASRRLRRKTMPSLPPSALYNQRAVTTSLRRSWPGGQAFSGEGVPLA